MEQKEKLIEKIANILKHPFESKIYLDDIGWRVTTLWLTEADIERITLELLPIIEAEVEKAIEETLKEAENLRILKNRKDRIGGK